MHYFLYRSGELHCEDVSVESLARAHGTPLYIYSVRTVLEHFRKLRRAFAHADLPAPPMICYAVKANSNLSLLKLMQKEGAGFDVVSGGELDRALRVGADPSKIVFAGVGKTDDEIRYALRKRIHMFNAESEQELEVINQLAGEEKVRPHVAIRVNPDVDPQTHKYITTGKRENKFGVDLERAKRIYARHKEFPNVSLSGVHCHIGSQITRVEPYVESLTRTARFIEEVGKLGAKIEHLDIGGGFGIWYKEKAARPAAEIAGALLPIIVKTGCRLALEPGRFIVGNAGVLITRVLYVKESGDKRFYICDAGMNDLIRPTLYDAYHKIWPVRTEASISGEAPDEEGYQGETWLTDVVGPICESGDFFARERRLPPVKRGDLLCVFSAGAYGFAMASNYNSMPRPAEVCVFGRDAKLATERETYEDLVRKERVVEFQGGF